MAYLARNPNITEPLTKSLREANDWEAFASVLAEAEDTETITEMKSLVAKVQESGLEHYIYHSIIWPHAPKFLYFDEYYQMRGQENLNELILREDAGQLLESDYPFLDSSTLLASIIESL